MTTFEATVTAPQSGATRLHTWVKQHALLTYGLLTFGLTWPFMIAEVLGSRGWIPFRLTFSGMGLFITLCVAYGPTLAALLVTGLVGGKKGIRTLLGRLLIWRVGWQWYAVTILGPGLVFFGAVQLHALRGGVGQPLPHFTWQTLLLLPVVFLVRGIVNGEEIGWRGFALPQLQTRWNALGSSLILGGIWALFHLPIFFVQGNSVLGSQSEMNPFGFLLSTLASAILVTWVFNNTRGSLLLAYLYHAAVNTWSSEIFRNNSLDGALLTLAAAIIVVVIFGPDRLARTPVVAAQTD